MATPQIGDPVWWDGMMHEVKDPVPLMGPEKAAQFVAKGCIVFENARYRTVAKVADLFWDADLAAYTAIGRALSREDRKRITELRDRGLLPSLSPTRSPGCAPMAEEDLDLYKALCHGKQKGFLEAELARVRKGEEMSAEGKAAIEKGCGCVDGLRKKHGITPHHGG